MPDNIPLGFAIPLTVVLIISYIILLLRQRKLRMDRERLEAQHRSILYVRENGKWVPVIPGGGIEATFEDGTFAVTRRNGPPNE